VWPSSEEDIITVVNACREHNVPIVPYGGGNGVCGGTVPVRGGVVIDMRGLSQIGAIDDVDLTVDVDSGVLGIHLEKSLQNLGYTLGHFPSAIESSTVGGWLATRSAGQFTSRYGKIEDMVVSIRAVLSNGALVETNTNQYVDWNQILVGSEGTLGLLTRARLRIYPTPECEAYRGYRFRSLDAGLLAIRRLMQTGVRPHVIRLHDPCDSLLNSSGEGSSKGGVTATMLASIKEVLLTGGNTSNKRTGRRLGLSLALSKPSILNGAVDRLPVPCLLVFGFQGSPQSVNDDMIAAKRLLEQAGGTDGGEGPGLRWKAEHHNGSSKRTDLSALGAFADTLDISCTWARVRDVYRTVRETVSPHALVVAHFSHAYEDGCSISFTFIGYRRDAAALERLYDRIWEEALEAVTKAGGSMSHHHGIGIAKREHMRREHGAGIRLLYALKNGLDPAAVLNPGKLLPDRAILE
jgi:alkyldihydroxyacetonephosphate synthase